MNKTAQRYIRQIKRAIPLRNMRAATANSLRESVCRYADEHPTAALQAYYSRFGTPGQIAEHALENAAPEELYRSLIRTRRVWRLVIGPAVFIIAGFLISLIAIISDNWNEVHGYSVEKIDVVSTDPAD